MIQSRQQAHSTHALVRRRDFGNSLTSQDTDPLHFDLATRSFVSNRSADVILSEVRPTHIKPEALRALNDFLDELLWLILSAARSFTTPKLKTALIKVLPTNLGKDCVLEAEVELRAYWERNPPAIPSPITQDEPSRPGEFPVHPAYEVRLCSD
jgi:hypothetical protein